MVSRKIKGRWYHWLTAATVALLALLLVLPSFIHWNSYRSVIEDLISDQIGAQVSLRGDIQAVLVPKPRITASDVDIPVLGQVQAVDMFLDPVALLTRQIIPIDLTVKGARLTVRQQADGHWDYTAVDDKKKNVPDNQITGAETVAPTLRQSIFSPELGRMSISNSVISLMYQGGIQQDVAIRSMDYLERDDSQVKTITALLLTRDVPVTLNAKFQPVGTMGNLSARVEAALPAGRLLFSGRVDENLAPLLGRVSFKGERLDTAFSHLMDVINQQMTLTGAPLPFDFDFRLEQDGGKDGGIKAKSFAFSLADAPGAAELSWHPEQGVEGTVRLGVLQTSQWQQAQFYMDPIKDFKSAEAAIDLLVQGVEDAQQAMQQLEARLLLKNGQLHIRHLKALLPGVTQFSLDGGYDPIQRQLVAEIALQSAAPRQFFTWMGIEGVDSVTDDRLATFSIHQGQLTWSGKDWSLSDIAGRVDASQFTGTLTGKRAPFYLEGIEATFDRLAVTPYQSLFKALLPEEREAGEGAAKKQASAPVKMAQTFKLQAGQIYLSDVNQQDVTLNDVNLHLAREGGRVIFREAEGSIAGGGKMTVTGHYPLMLAANGPLNNTQGDGKAVKDQPTPDMDLSVIGQGVSAPWVAGFIQDRLPAAALPVLIGAQQDMPVDVTITLKGALERAELGFLLTAKGQKLNLNGTVHNGLDMAGYSLSGALQNSEDSAFLLPDMPLMKLVGQKGLKAALTVDKKVGASAIHVKLNGQISDQISDQPSRQEFGLSYGYDDGRYTGTMSVKAVKGSAFDVRSFTDNLTAALGGQHRPMIETIFTPPHTDTVGTDFSLVTDFRHGDGQTLFENINVGAGDWSVKGGLEYTEISNTPHITADLMIAGLSYPISDFTDYLVQGWPADKFPSVSSAATGVMNLTLKNAQIMGQSFTDLPLTVTLTDQAVSLKTKGPSGSGNVQEDKRPKIDLTFQRFGSYKKSDTQGQALGNQRQLKLVLDLPEFQTDSHWQTWQQWLPLRTVESRLQLDLKGQGQSLQEIIRNLQGQLSWAAEATDSSEKDQKKNQKENLEQSKKMLEGFDAGAISWAARTSKSNVAFLKNLPVWTSSGQNRVDHFTISAVVDSGIALLEQGRFTGPWGRLDMGGQIDLAARAVQMKGDVSFAALPNTVMETVLSGPFWGVNKSYDLRQIEKFVSARIQNEQRQQMTEIVNKAAGPSPIMRVYELMLPSLRQKQKKALEEATKALRQNIAEQNTQPQTQP